MFKQKKFMVYLVTVFLLIVSMLIAACGGPGETKKDTAQNNKPIEITDVTGRTVTLKKPAESCLTVEWCWWSILYDFRTYGQGYAKGYRWYGYIFAGLQGGYVETLHYGNA